jgi:hypothetical protein
LNWILQDQKSLLQGAKKPFHILSYRFKIVIQKPFIGLVLHVILPDTVIHSKCTLDLQVCNCCIKSCYGLVIVKPKKWTFFTVKTFLNMKQRLGRLEMELSPFPCSREAVPNGVKTNNSQYNQPGNPRVR